MALAGEFIKALTRLGRVCELYRQRSGFDAILVGGAAVSFYTDGLILSGDFDLVASNDEAFDGAMAAEGFVKEHRRGHLLVGWYHPELPEYGFQLVSGPLFDGRADRRRVRIFRLGTESSVALPSIEDMIADRLAQATATSRTDRTMLRQAILLRKLAPDIDRDYLLRRVQEEGGDVSMIDMGES
jgi:hypothetical protein